MLFVFEDPAWFISSNRLNKDVSDTFHVEFRAKKGLVLLPNPYITILPLLDEKYYIILRSSLFAGRLKNHTLCFSQVIIILSSPPHCPLLS